MKNKILNLLGVVMALLFYVLPDSCSLLGMKVCDLFSHSKEDYTFIKRKILSIKNK